MAQYLKNILFVLSTRFKGMLDHFVDCANTKRCAWCSATVVCNDCPPGWIVLNRGLFDTYYLCTECIKERRARIPGGNVYVCAGQNKE